MATMRVLTACGLLLAFCALALLAVAMSTDYWYETDARRHRERCKKYSGKRLDPGYIYISSQNLPLRMLPQRPERSGAMLRERRDVLPPSSAMESRCSRKFNSTATGLWRKCHREGFDQENEELIFKGETCWDRALQAQLSASVHDSAPVSIEIMQAAHSIEHGNYSHRRGDTISANKTPALAPLLNQRLHRVYISRVL